MTATLAQVRAGIRTSLENAALFDTVYGYQPGVPTPPCAIVGWPDSYDPQYVVNGTSWTAIIPVRVLVQTGENSSADVKLGSLIEPVVAVFNTNPAVVANVDAVVVEVNEFGPVLDAAGVTYLSCVFQIEAICG